MRGPHTNNDRRRKRREERKDRWSTKASGRSSAIQDEGGAEGSEGFAAAIAKMTI